MALQYSFAGKKVLITGGGQGIGRQLVQRFHDDGATVFTVDKNAETIKKLKEELPSVTAQVVDLTDWEESRKVIQSFGVIDHLVNNAGVGVCAEFMMITKELANLHFDVNVAALVNVSQVVAKGLMEAGREGSIVNISSMAARFGSKLGAGMNSCTKAAVENLTKSMALELGAHKIRVNCVLPGVVDTPTLFHPGDLWKENNPENTYFQRLIFKRLIKPNEVAELIMFLLSPLSSMIVGQGVVVDGGFLAG